jgi:X-X-X-Leu-X-X-Gly heptad repeat protein
MNGMVNGVNTANKGMNTMINGVNTANKGMNTMINGVNTANKGMNDTNKSVQYINDSLDKLDENLTMVYLLNNNMININHEYIAQSPQSTNQLQGFVDGLNEAVVSNIDGITGLFSTPPEQTVKQTIQAIKNRKKIYQAINQQFFKEVIAGTDYTNAKFAGRLYGETFIFLATGGSSDVEKLNTITNLDKLENLSKLERVDNLADLIKKKSLGLGSTGRTVPKTLEEQLYMKEVLADPMHDATSVPIKMTDAGRWEDKDGWVKMQRIFKSSDKNQKNITIHFVYNTKTRQFDDFKFK